MQEIQGILFDGEFEEEIDICWNCGSESAVLIGYNEEKDIDKIECKNCNCIFIDDRKGKSTIIRGNKRNWMEHLSNNLDFPFEGVVDEFQDYGSLQKGDEIIVDTIDFDDDCHGVIAKVKHGKKKYDFPIVDIAVKDKKSPCFKILDDYRTWFANCR